MDLLAWITEAMWSWPLPLALAATHIMLTLRLHGVQRYTGCALKLSLHTAESKKGISGFGALATSVGAAMGAGNIWGMGVAISVGGPGAVLWFVVAGGLGMATQYAESRLSLASRKSDVTGQNWGGPMLALLRAGYPKLGRWYAILLVLASLATGCLLQARAVVLALDPWRVPQPVVLLLLTLGSASVILFGGKRIARASERLVPAMIVLYLCGCAGLLVLCRRQILPALLAVFRQAFALRPVLGGGMGAAIQSGFARGLLAGEAGLGTCGIAAAGTDTPPQEQALISMSTGLWTTLLGGLTGLALTAASLTFPDAAAQVSASELTSRLFSLLPGGAGLLAVSLCIFSFTSILGWCYYGQMGVRALTKSPMAVRFYQVIFLLALSTACWIPDTALWRCADLCNGFLALPNLFCLWRLRGQIPHVRLTNRAE